MRPFRFIHAADLHLDSPFRGLQPLPPAVRDRVRGSTFAALDALVELALRERVDFVLIAGDVYDAADRSIRAQIRFRKAAERLAAASIPLFAVHGNHDPDDGRSAKLAWPDTVRFLSAQEVECADVRATDGTLLAYIYGMSFATPAVKSNLAAQFAVRSGAPYHIALLHANVDGNEGHDNYAPCTLQELTNSGFDYWALGHVHDRRVLSDAPFVVYPGNTQGRSMRETGAKGCCLVEVSDTGRTELHFCPLDDVRWFREVCSIEGMEAEEQLLDAVRQRMERVRGLAEGRAAMLRLVLTGRGPLHAKLRRAGMLDELVAELRDEEERLAAASASAPFVWIETVKPETGAAIDRDELLAQASFLGDMLRQTQRLIEDEAELAELVREAIAPLTAHAKLSRLADEAGAEHWKEWLRAAEEMAIDALTPDQKPE